MARLNNLLQELRRRNVIRAGVAYVVSAWLLVQIADVLAAVFVIPDWVMQALVIALALGLPAAIVFSWFFEVTMAGIKRTEEVSADDSSGKIFDRRLDFVIIGALAVGLVLSLYGNFLGSETPTEPISVLIADFDNETGSDLYSGVLEDTLRIGLEVAPFIDAYSRKTARDAAADLFGADAEFVILDLESAGLIALREGINIVIGGRVSRNDDGLTISVTGLAPGDQQQLFAVTENAETDADILHVIAVIAKRLRLELGDTEKPDGAGDMESFVVANLEAAAEYLKAQDLQLDRKLEEAVVHYEKALQLDPEFARAYAGLALTEQYLGRAEDATQHWQEVLSRLNTLTERGQLRTLGNYYMKNQRDYEKALDTYERLVERYPADNVAQNNLAVTAFYALDFERALEVGRSVAERFPKHSGYRANLALYAMYANRFEEASSVAKKLIEDETRSAYAFFVVAMTHAVDGEFAAAEKTYQLMMELGQFGRSVATEGLADLAIYRGDVAAAIAILDVAIEEELAQNANHTVALKQVMRAEALLLVNERKKAQGAIDMALEYSGGDPAVLVPAALSLTELGETGRAMDIAADMSKSFSKSQRAYAHAIRAYVASKRNQPKIAIGHADAAIEEADLWLIRFIRGKAYIEAGLFAEAAADLQVCQQRRGEGIARFLNDRPSIRMMLDLDAAIATTNAPQKAVSSVQ